MVGTSPTTRRSKHALERRKSASPCCEQPRGGPGREPMPVLDERGCVNSTKGGEGAGSGDNEENP